MGLLRCNKSARPDRVEMNFVISFGAHQDLGDGSFVAAKLLELSPMMPENRTKADSSKKRVSF